MRYALAGVLCLLGAAHLFGAQQTYTVKKGDSLYVIAKRFHTNVKELKRINNLSGIRLKPGAKLVVGSVGSAETKVPLDTETIPSGARQTYTVRKGDSLYVIAKRFHTNVKELERINNLSSMRLKPGTKLVVSSVDKIETKVSLDTETIRRTERTFHTVAKGDVPGAIARRHGISLAQLKKLNGLKSNRIKPGQRLLVKIEKASVPVPEKKIVVEEEDEELEQIQEQNDRTFDLLKNFSEGDLGGGMINTAMSFLNCPYRLGGNTRAGIDCSGLVKKSFGAVGVELPRTSRAQALIGEPISLTNLLPGDLVFFKKRSRRQISHVAIYIGDGKILHATHKGGKVMIDSLEDDFFTTK